MSRMRRARMCLLGVMLGVLAFLVAACAASPAPTATAVPPTPTPALRPVAYLNLGTEPPTLDPAISTDSVSIDIVRSLFVGLTQIDEKTSEILPDLAEKWTISPDGTVYTFPLRKDVKWSDGKSVTAHDVVYGVRRTLDPATASEYAHTLTPFIKGAEGFNAGTAKDPAVVGVKALDDYTVEVTLNKPAAYFPSIASMWVMFPQPKWAIEAHGDKWIEAGKIVTNGPYRLLTWEHEKSLVLKKNPDYYAADKVAFETVNFVMVSAESTAMTMYEAGALDAMYPGGPPLEDLDRIKADPVLKKELYIAPRLCTYYYGFNTTKPPFDKPLVRKAFAAAIDRQALIDNVLKGGQKPATTFTAPGVFGYVDGLGLGIGHTFDPAKAKKHLADAGYPNGQGLPEITLMFNTSEGHQKIAQAIQGMWKEHLGVQVKLVNQEFGVYLKTLSSDAPQVWRLGWCADYPDANNWQNDVFHSKSGNNYGLFKNAAFDKLVEDAATEPDPKRRLEQYKQAETILSNDEAALAPIYFYTFVQLTKPYMTRTYSPFGGEMFHHWRGFIP